MLTADISWIPAFARMTKILLACLAFMLSPMTTIAQECIAAFDFGQGGVFYIPANPDEGSTSSTNLVFDSPPQHQVARWISTSFSTIGQSVSSGEGNELESILKVYIDGKWAPWGGDINKIHKRCDLKQCDPADAEQVPCLDDGMHTYVNPEASNVPCVLDGGWGLYGLIALDYGNTRADPNDPIYARDLPPESFRTFRLAPLQYDKDGQFFALHFSQQCDRDASGQTICLRDKDANGRDVVARGGLYFKILDDHYQDNTGGYVINIASGVVSKPGFIQIAIQYFTDVMHDVTKSLYKGLTGDLGFLSMVRALLLLYVVISGLLFMMGMLRMHISELLIRLLKIGFVSVVISNNSWEFFNTYLFSFFTTGAQSIATMVTQAAFTYSSKFGMGQYILPEGATAVSVFDNVLKMMLHPSIHKKLFGMALHKWYIIYMVFIYVCIGILITAIIRSLALYVTAVMLVTILLVISPLFIIMILFRITKEFFDTWLKQLLVNALMLIVVSSTMALMVNLLLNQFESLLYYRVCYDIVWTFKVGSFTVFDLYFWKPTDPSQVDACLTPVNFFSYLFVCILFNSFMQEIPAMIDALAASGLMPLTHLSQGAAHTLQSTKIYQYTTSAVTQARSVLAPLTWTEPGRQLLGIGTMLSSTVTQKYERAMYGGGGRTNTQVLSGVRDIVGRQIDRGKAIITPKDRGIFE